jgi:hypothetical protein
MTVRAALLAWLAVGACGRGDTPTPTAAPAKDERSAATDSIEVEPSLRALALVNERDPARARSIAERHALLRELAGTGDAALVDEALNFALDLVQAEQSSTPCTTFRNALDGLWARPDPAAADMVRAAKVPRSLTAGRAPDGDCGGLDALRIELLALMVSEPTTEPPQPVAPAPTRPRVRATGVAKPRPEPSAAASREAAAPVAGKLDDELRPFGK